MLRRVGVLTILAIASAAPIPFPPRGRAISAVPATVASPISKRGTPTDLPPHVRDPPIVMPPAPWVLRRSIPDEAHTTGIASAAPAFSATSSSESSPPRFHWPKGEMAPPSHFHSPRDEAACKQALAQIPGKFIPEGAVPHECFEAWNSPFPSQPHTARNVDASSHRKRDTDWSALLGIDNLLYKGACKLQTLHWHVPESWAWDEIPEVCKMAYDMVPSEHPVYGKRYDLLSRLREAAVVADAEDHIEEAPVEKDDQRASHSLPSHEHHGEMSRTIGLPHRPNHPPRTKKCVAEGARRVHEVQGYEN